MNKIITLAAAASLLTLAACNRDAETAPAIDDGAATSADSMSADTNAVDVSANAPRRSSSAASTDSAASRSETMGGAAPSTADPTGTSVSGVSDQTRETAQADAEATNLHPKPSGTY